MTVLDASTIKAYAAQAGFSGQNLNTITAIALAESGGDTAAVNSSDPGGGSYGLLQINGAHFHKGGTTKECALDAQCSMNYAFMLWSSQGFEPWGSYDPHNPNVTPAYENFLPTAEQAPQGGGGYNPTPRNPNAPGYKGGAGTPGFLDQIIQLIPWIGNPLRIIKLVAGIGLIVISLLFLVVPGAIDKTTALTNKVQKAVPGL